MSLRVFSWIVLLYPQPAVAQNSLTRIADQPYPTTRKFDLTLDLWAALLPASCLFISGVVL